MTEKLPFKVGLVPYELRHERNLAALALSELEWPRQDQLNRGCIGDLAPEDHVVVYPSSTRLLRSLGPLVCKVDLILAEPLAIQGRYYSMLWALRHKFNSIYCRYGAYASRYSNVHQLAVVESWVDGTLVNYQAPKTKFCSIIVSAKKDQLGHVLRHAVVDWSRKYGLDISVLGRGYQPFQLKQEGLLPYHYSVVIENVQEADYFTEKLLDCILCGTMPIYWGAPNIGDYFDALGIHICHNYDDLLEVIAAIASAHRSIHRPTNSPTNRSTQRLGPTSEQHFAMDVNRERALSLSRLKPRIVDNIYSQGN